MDVTKAPPFDPAPNRAGGEPASQQSAATGAAASPVPLADRVDIQALGTAAALQILIAEVHAEFEWPAPAPTTQSPAQASLVLIQMFLQAMPESEGEFSDWESAAIRLELALGSAMDRALAVVERWRDVPQIAVDAVKETRVLVTDQLSDEPSNPLWLRPEWLALCPGLQAFRRRRRLGRRGLIDPDSQPIQGDAADNADRAAPRDPAADMEPPLERKP